MLRIHPKSIQIVPQALRNPCATIYESFQEGLSDFQHLPKSAMFKKAWAIAQAFCSKSANFGPKRIHSKSIQIVPPALRNPFATIYESFQEGLSVFQHLPKSAMFKSMGYSPGFLLKIAQFRTLANSPEIHSNSPASTGKYIYKHIGVLSGSLERFPTLAKIRHVQKHGL